jgi:cellulose biosynthesis protein BcsQ
VAARVITVVNMKGGVGKTTTVIALAETLAAMDRAGVLVIDLDTQASASYSMVGDRILTDLIQNDRTIDAYFDACLVHKQPIRLMDLVHRNASTITHLSQSPLPISFQREYRQYVPPAVPMRLISFVRLSGTRSDRCNIRRRSRNTGKWLANDVWLNPNS